MSPLGWHPPHLVANTDTRYLGDQHGQKCWVFLEIYFLFCVYLFVYVLVRVSVHLSTINLKFLKTHNYWLAHSYMWA